MQLDGRAGLAGWQWLFLVEGAPAILIGLLVPFLLTDRPANARWLTSSQSQWLQDTLDAEDHTKPHLPLLTALVQPSILALCAVYFCMMMGLYGLSFWMPTILQSGGTLSNTQISLIAAIPYAIGALAMFFYGRHSDLAAEREWHTAVALAVGALGFALVALSRGTVVAMLGFTLVSVGVFCAMPTFWPLPSVRLRGTAAAGGIALVNSVGNLGGFVGPYLIGYLKETRLGYPGGLLTTACFLLAGAVAVIVTRTAHSAPTASPTT
jgi:ACS family tartrate transporter-like MFS transporter